MEPSMAARVCICFRRRFPWSIAAGDFNRDGKLDLAVSNYGDNSLSVLLGNGDGTFQAPLTSPVGTTLHR